MSIHRSAGIAAFILYTFVVLEFLYMITPFLAFGYYAVYGQFLGVFNSSPLTSWLTGFFLPHFSDTDAGWLHQLAAWGRRLGIVAIVGFLVTAGQIYWAKFTRGGMVHGGLYSLVRHPQYAFLILLGLATLMIWPRFLILYAFAIMLFLYVVLARHEEDVCLAKYGDSYRDYRRRTGMFVPRLLPPPSQTPVARQTWRSAAILFAVVMAGATALGFGLREYTLGAISAIYARNEAIVAPASLPEAELEHIATLAAADPRVQARRQQATGGTQWVIYVVPADWYIPDLPIDPLDYVARHGGHGAPRNYDRMKWQVLFTTARSWNNSATHRDILSHAYGIAPVVLANVDMETQAVTEIATPPPHVVWGDIAAPLF